MKELKYGWLFDENFFRIKNFNNIYLTEYILLGEICDILSLYHISIRNILNMR